MSAHVGLSRRRVTALLGAAAAAPLLPGRLYAADEGYPNRVVRVIVPWPAGAITDMTAPGNLGHRHGVQAAGGRHLGDLRRAARARDRVRVQ